MKEKIKSKLDKLFDLADEKKVEKEKKQEEIKSAESFFLEEFSKTRDEVIKPALLEVGELLHKRGHDYSLSQNDEETDHKQRIKASSMTIDIFPEGRKGGPSDNHPHLSFNADKSKRIVWIHGSNMVFSHSGSAGKRGEYELNNITSDTVQTEVAKLLDEVFNK